MQKINSSKLFTLIAIVAIIGLLLFRRFSPIIDTSWAEDKACTEVKSEVYQTYGEIPTVSGNVVYNNGRNYIVIVKYSIPGWDWKGSRACNIYGFGKDNCHLNNMTNELAYDYQYNVEELKARWAIE